MVVVKGGPGLGGDENSVSGGLTVGGGVGSDRAEMETDE